MPPRPEVQPLTATRRRIVFIMSLTAFLVMVPLFVFYAIGYRFDFSGEVNNIRAVGGMYISAEVDDIAIYVDDEPVENMRIFQNAAYVQNLEAGLHQIHVQGDDIQTWVKYLPVYAHFVTEASSFNMPERPQLRLVTAYQTFDGQSIVKESPTSTFAFASTTNRWLATSTTATSSFVVNPEYEYVTSLLASSTAERTAFARWLELQEERFRFSDEAATITLATTTATTTVEFRDVRLHEDNGEIVAHWVGSKDRQPYYYCVEYRGQTVTGLAYGSHVEADLVAEYGTTTDFTDPALVGQELCRQTIRIDRIGQSVQYFNFVSNSEHHVLLQLQDGVYVVEVDDRSWQNVQLLYPGDYLEVIVEGGQIYVKDGEYLFEVLTEIPS